MNYQLTLTHSLVTHFSFKYNYVVHLNQLTSIRSIIQISLSQCCLSVEVAIEEHNRTGCKGMVVGRHAGEFS